MDLIPFNNYVLAREEEDNLGVILNGVIEDVDLFNSITPIVESEVNCSSRLLQKLKKPILPIINDFGLQRQPSEACRDLLEVIED